MAWAIDVYKRQVRERFERAIYMMHRHNIVSVWSEGKNVVC